MAKHEKRKGDYNQEESHESDPSGRKISHVMVLPIGEQFSLRSSNAGTLSPLSWLWPSAATTSTSWVSELCTREYGAGRVGEGR
jgi:hypothetical protein